MDPNNILEAALQYAGRGWRVLPLYGLRGEGAGGCSCRKGEQCESPGKHPCIKTGKAFAVASSDPRQVAAWFGGIREKNVGIATGQGLAVVDIDGAAGLATLRHVVHGLPRTLCAETGRGLHLYFRVHGSIPTNSGDGLDIRGDGGLVVAPPSRHVSGRHYTWIDPLAPIADMPAELLSWFRNRKGKAGAKAGAEPVTPSHNIPNYLHSARGRLADRASAGLEEPANAQDLEALAATIPNAECGWDEWNRLGMAFYRASDGSDAGLEAFKDWSSKSNKYDEQTTISRWEHYGRSPPDSIGMGSLVREAREAVPGFNLPSWGMSIAPNAVSHAPQATTELPKDFVVTFPDRIKGKPRPTAVNAYVAIKALGITCRKDVFHDRMLVGGHARAELIGDLSDATIQILRRVIYEQFRFDPGLHNTDHATVQLCLENQFDPVVSYIESLVWDKVPRVAKWLAKYLGAADTILNAHVGRLVLAAAVRRARSPGCKFDQIVVLEGPEGTKKSSAIEVLAGAENFSDQDILTLDGRGQQEAVQGIWLYEIADLSGIARADVEKVKAFASRKVDRARPAYGRHREDKPRRCIFFATTNDATYLKSPTGNRRFWPIPTGMIDLDGLARDRDQLWAEAAAIEHALPNLFLAESLWADARVLQESRREIDPLEDFLMSVDGALHQDGPFDSGDYRISNEQLWTTALRDERKTDFTAKRVRYIMEKLGWKYAPNGLRINGKKVRGFSRPK